MFGHLDVAIVIDELSSGFRNFVRRMEWSEDSTESVMITFGGVTLAEALYATALFALLIRRKVIS